MILRRSQYSSYKTNLCNLVQRNKNQCTGRKKFRRNSSKQSFRNHRNHDCNCRTIWALLVRSFLRNLVELNSGHLFDDRFFFDDLGCLGSEIELSDRHQSD